MGVLCNVLVTLGVLIALTGKDTTGRVVGAYLPVAFFVICGFEHSVANMFYIPAGLFAKSIPHYAQLATQAGVNLTNLTWQNFLLGNLPPVTFGNILGGMSVAAVYYFCHLKGKRD